MPKFRKKPVVIEAFNFTGGMSYDEMCVDWGDIFADVAKHQNVINVIDIQTLEGTMTAHLGDWIIRGVKGEFYPCNPDIFEQTYEHVGEP